MPIGPALRLTLSAGLILIPAAMIAAGGCSRSNSPAASTLTIADFADPELASTPAVASRPSSSASVIGGRQGLGAQGLGVQSGSTTTGPFGAAEGILDITADAGEPAMPEPTAAPATTSNRVEELVEAKVGDVNNKPIFASDFLEPMGARLAAEAVKRRPEEWRRWARSEIKQELELQIEDELLRSEAYSKLKPEERQGLFSFLQTWQESMIQSSGGSRAKANQSLLDEKGYDLDQALRQRENEELIKLQLREQVKSRVQVSRRDIELAYEKAYKTFNPDPKAVLRWIHVPAEKAGQIDEIDAALKSGEEFAVVAANPANEYNSRGGGLRDPATLKEGEVAKTDFFAIKELNQAAQALNEGRWQGPVKYKTSSGKDYVGWLYLEKVDRQQMSMYEVQLQLERYLRDVGENKRRREYIDELKARASYTNIDQMVDRLTSIAAERYGPGTAAAKAASLRAGKQKDTKSADAKQADLKAAEPKTAEPKAAGTPATK